MARIILFGGHGKIALLAEPLLAERGDAVTAVIRNPDHADEVRAAGAEPLVADIEQLDTAALAELISGHDAVVWSAGAGGGSRSARAPSTTTPRCAPWTPPSRPECAAT